MQVTLIRHGKTYSNVEHRYQGRIDDSLCPDGMDVLRRKEKKKFYEFPDRLVCSPKIRCKQTARLLFPDFPEKDYIIENDLRETDFGIFEGKTYQELCDTPEYKAWLDTNGEGLIPGGESKEDMSARCIASFDKQIKKAMQDHIQKLTFVIHGGSIMAILEKFSASESPFYEYHIDNGEGYTFTVNEWSSEAKYPVKKIGVEE